jgi:glycosyltransferase involved in cell wall biosynthesis
MAEAWYPRILSVDAAALSHSSDMAILKTHLFDGWPPGYHAQVVIGNAPVDLNLCGSSWRVTRDDLVNGRSGGPVTVGPEPVRAGVAPRAGAADQVRRRVRAVAQPLLYAASDAAMMRGDIRTNAALRQWIERFRPDVVFTFGGSATICRAAASLADELGVPTIPYFTDDWISYLYARRPIKWALRKRLCHWVDRLLARAPVGLTICELMASEYSGRFGRRFVACMDSVDLERYSPSEPDRETSDEVTLSYIGVMGPNRWQVLRMIGEQVYALRGGGARVRLHMYTMPAEARLYAGRLTLGNDVRIVGSLEYDDVPKTQSASDVLVHVESFRSGVDAARTRLSMSTKIPQYLAAGRPVLAVGPGDRASVRYLKHCGAALAVERPDPALICSAITDLLQPDLRRRLGEAGRMACERNHRRDRMKSQFAEVVRGVCGR